MQFWVLGEPFACLVCRGGTFTSREVKLNTTALELFDMGWANASALGVVCTRCSYVHEFAATDALTMRVV